MYLNLPQGWQIKDGLIKMDITDEYNFPSTLDLTDKLGNPTVLVPYQMTDAMGYKETREVRCKACLHEGYRLDVVSEKTERPVCRCTPDCSQIKGLKPISTMYDSQQFPGYCTFKTNEQRDGGFDQYNLAKIRL